MSASVDDYLALITPWQSTHPRFTGTVSATLLPVTEVGAVAASLPAAFDLDTAIGVQLDHVGEWVGQARYVTIPLPQRWFSFGDDLRGWGRGEWRQAYSAPTRLASLADEDYRRLLRAVIAANHWDGTVPGAQACLDIFYIDPATHVFIQDNAQVASPVAWFSFGVEGCGWGQARWYDPAAAVEAPNLVKVDVSMTIGVSGKIPDATTLGLMASGAINIKPAGVEQRYAVTTVDSAPLFGFGVDNEYVGGWGSGAWGATPDRVLSNL